MLNALHEFDMIKGLLQLILFSPEFSMLMILSPCKGKGKDFYGQGVQQRRIESVNYQLLVVVLVYNNSLSTTCSSAGVQQ